MPLYFRLAFELVFQLRKGSFDMNDKGAAASCCRFSFTHTTKREMSRAGTTGLLWASAPQAQTPERKATEPTLLGPLRLLPGTLVIAREASQARPKAPQHQRQHRTRTGCFSTNREERAECQGFLLPIQSNKTFQNRGPMTVQLLRHV